MSSVFSALTPYLSRAASRFSRTASPAIGLDINAAEIRLVELSRSGKHVLRLERHACENLPYGVVGSDGIEDFHQLTEIAQRLWQNSGARAKRVVLGLPSSAVTTAVVAIARNANEKQREALASAHAAQFLPYPAQEAHIDFCIIGPVRENPDEVELLIAAVRKETLEDRVAVAESLGLQPVVADIDSYAAHAALRHLPGADPRQPAPAIALARMDLHSTHISVLAGGRIVSDQEHAFGHQQLTQDIMQAFGLSQETAACQQKNHSLPAAYADDVLAPHVEHAARQIAHGLQTQGATAGIADIDSIVLAGSGAAIPGLAQAVRRHAKISTTVAAPFADLPLANHIDPQRWKTEAPACLVACGLALRGFDR